MSAKSKTKLFRHLLKDERKRTGITQVKAAEILSMSVRTYEDWEAGYSTPAIAHQEGVLARLAATPTAK